MDLLSWDAPEWHASIDSTNLEALRDPRPGRVVVADHQSAGLGRRGRSWTAPPDSSIAVSVVLPAPDPAGLGWVPLVTGLAVSRALARSRYAVSTVLKWPNDVLARDGQEWLKICGVLAHAVPQGGSGPVVVVGAGVNIDQTREELPVPTATSWRLARGGPNHKVTVGGRVTAPLPDGAREQFVADYLDEVADLMSTLASDAGTVHTAYRSLCSTIGARVQVHLPEGGTRTGTAVHVDENGALVVEGDGRTSVHLAGDVVHVRPAD